jgi:hypothetical protein
MELDSRCPRCQLPLSTINGDPVTTVLRRVDDANEQLLTDQFLANLDENGDGYPMTPPRDPGSPLMAPLGPQREIRRRRRDDDEDHNPSPSQRPRGVLGAELRDETLSWLFVPLIHAALNRNANIQTVNDGWLLRASSYFPPNVWANTIILLARDFRERGVTRAVDRLPNAGYIQAHDQEAVLDGVAYAAISAIFDLVPLQRNNHHLAAATAAAVATALANSDIASHLLLPSDHFIAAYDL